MQKSDGGYPVAFIFLRLKTLILLRLDGAQGRNRTVDTRIFSPLLYRLSYLGNPLASFGLALLPHQRTKE
jgi:hypothetical protein